MSLFGIEMAPVPLDAETYLGEKREYTQIIYSFNAGTNIVMC